MPNQIVWLVVVIGLALLAFLIGGGMLNTSKMQLGSLMDWLTGTKRDLGIKSMEDSCNAWLSGAEKYSAKAIGERYLVAENAGPYGAKLDCCSPKLRDKVIANNQACVADAASAACNDGNIGPNDADFKNCQSACRAILTMAGSCRTKCPATQQSMCVDKNIMASTALCSGTAPTVAC